VIKVSAYEINGHLPLRLCLPNNSIAKHSIATHSIAKCLNCQVLGKSS
jgi:hypothetical protein